MPFNNQQNNYGPPTTEVRFIQGGDTSAMAYAVMPGTGVMLIDQEIKKFYIKTVNYDGTPKPLRRFNYEEDPMEIPIQTAGSQMDMSNYLTKDEFKESMGQLLDEIKSINKNHYKNKRYGGEGNGRQE